MSDESFYIILVCLTIAIGVSVTAGCAGVALSPPDGLKKISTVSCVLWFTLPIIFWSAIAKVLLQWV